MITFHNVVQGSPEWHALHDDLWTGSTAIKLLQDRPLPDWGTFAGNKYTRRGKLLEPIAIREFEVQTDTDVQIIGFVTNSKYPKAGYSPDGICGDTLLEVKCLNGERHEALARGEIPLEYEVQIRFGMLICELKQAKLLAFNPEYGQQLTIIDIPYKKAVANHIKRKLLT